MSWVLSLIIALMAGFVGAWTTYFFSLRGDKEERRRERVIAHLIDAYRSIENASNRKNRTPEMTQKLESSIAATCLFGSPTVVAEVVKLGTAWASGGRDMTSLLKALRRDLRGELGLEHHEFDFLSFRIDK